MNYPKDKSNNGASTVLLLRFGSFEFLDAADPTCQLELKEEADNTPDEFIAITEPAGTCKARHIELHVVPDGSSYTVRIPAKKHEKNYRTK